MEQMSPPPNESVEAFQRCIGYLDQALLQLSEPLSSEMREVGWSDEKLAGLRALLVAWRRDFDEDGRISVRQHRIVNRWFLDADLDFPTVAELLASVDNTVYDALGLP
jgi:hypothetical protein